MYLSKLVTSHKYVTFHTTVHRLLTVPLSDDKVQEELTNITAIAVNNGYKYNVNYAVIKKAKKVMCLCKEAFMQYSLRK